MNPQQKLESLQYNTVLAITSAARMSSIEEVGLESLKLRRWYITITFSVGLLKMKHFYFFLTWYQPLIGSVKLAIYQTLLYLL